MPTFASAAVLPPSDGLARDSRVNAGRRRCLQSAVALLGAAGGSARALEPATGPVLLTVSGRVRHTNEGAAAHFDLAMLSALPQQTVSTKTPWYPQSRRFTGPLLREVLTAAGAQGSGLRLVALNDYRVDMPFDDALRYDVLVARLLDDKPMTVREKGPLFVIYPFDDVPQLRSALYYGRSAWQLRTIEVV